MRPFIAEPIDGFSIKIGFLYKEDSMNDYRSELVARLLAKDSEGRQHLIEEHCALERAQGATNWTVLWTRHVTSGGIHLKRSSETVFVGIDRPGVVLTVIAVDGDPSATAAPFNV